MKFNVFVAIDAIATVMTVSAVSTDATSAEGNDPSSYLLLKWLLNLAFTRFAQTDCDSFHPWFLSQTHLS